MVSKGVGGGRDAQQAGVPSLVRLLALIEIVLPPKRGAGADELGADGVVEGVAAAAKNLPLLQRADRARLKCLQALRRLAA